MQHTRDLLAIYDSKKAKKSEQAGVHVNSPVDITPPPSTSDDLRSLSPYEEYNEDGNLSCFVFIVFRN